MNDCEIKFENKPDCILDDVIDTCFEPLVENIAMVHDIKSKHEINENISTLKLELKQFPSYFICAFLSKSFTYSITISYHSEVEKKN